MTVEIAVAEIFILCTGAIGVIYGIINVCLVSALTFTEQVKSVTLDDVVSGNESIQNEEKDNESALLSRAENVSQEKLEKMKMI